MTALVLRFPKIAVPSYVVNRKLTIIGRNPSTVIPLLANQDLTTMLKYVYSMGRLVGKVGNVLTRIRWLILFHNRKVYLEYERKGVKMVDFSRKNKENFVRPY